MMDFRIPPKIDDVADSLQLALLLEVAAPKPGNVSPEADFSDTTYIDFLASSAVLHRVFRDACFCGYQARLGDKQISHIGVGKFILQGVSLMSEATGVKNTHLGCLILLVPLAVAKGVGLARRSKPAKLEFDLSYILKNTSVDDAINLYQAIRIANAGGLGQAEIDVNDDESINQIREKELTFRDVMALAAERDGVASQISSDYSEVFNDCLPMMQRIQQRSGDIRKTITQLSLYVLAKRPDTLIARKVGLEKAKEISHTARAILDVGGVFTQEGGTALLEFDVYLRSKSNELNPGTTADLVTATLACGLLSGFRIG